MNNELKLSQLKGNLLLSDIIIHPEEDEILLEILDGTLQPEDIIKELVAYYKNVNKVSDLSD